MKSKKIGIVILNYNSYSDSIRMVNELQEQTVSSDCCIVVVDNASPNGSFEQLKPLERLWSNVVVLQTGANLGYARGNNFGLNYLEQHIKPNYVAILNNDIYLTFDCFEKLIERYESLHNAGLIAPKQIMTDGAIYVGGGISRFRDDFKNLFFLYRYMSKSSMSSSAQLPTEGNLPVEIVLGSFIFASMERFKTMGYFYPNTFLFVEERFVAFRAIQHGFQNYVMMDMSYLHAHSKSINTAFSQVQKYRMQYDGWMEFTRTCRKFGALKAMFLRPFIAYSLFEIAMVYKTLNIKKIFKEQKV